MPSVMLPSKAVEEVFEEMREATRKGYDMAHDDQHGSGHLVTEAVHRLTHMGETPTDDAVKHEIVVAIGLLFNAYTTLDRALGSGHTIAI